MNEIKSPTRPGYLSIGGSKSGEKIQFTLNQQNGEVTYARTYNLTINDADEVTFPNDLNARTQMLCKAIALVMKYPNSYEGDSAAEMGKM